MGCALSTEGSCGVILHCGVHPTMKLLLISTESPCELQKSTPELQLTVFLENLHNVMDVQTSMDVHIASHKSTFFCPSHFMQHYGDNGL